MPDERFLTTDTILPFDPAIELRQRATAFIASREWTTDQIFVCDCREPTVDQYGDDSLLEDGSEPEGEQRWSLWFELGLDHIHTAEADWFSDVIAIMDFLQQIYDETGCESRIEFRRRSKHWFSEAIGYVDCKPRQGDIIHEMIELMARCP